MSIENDARAKFATMTAAAQTEFKAAWARAESAVTTRTLEHFRREHKRPAKTFEVHHATEHARGLFFAAFVADASPAECEAKALAPVTVP